MAHGLVRHLAENQSVPLILDSCGTSGYHAGEAPDLRAQAKMEEKGIDISDLRSRAFSQSDFIEFDEIYVMDMSNLKDVVAMAQTEEHRNKVQLFLKLGTKENLEVPDPYYGSVDGFEHIYQLLQSSAKTLIAKHQ
jgi:protein-tyrosine phosphatase